MAPLTRLANVLDSSGGPLTAALLGAVYLYAHYGSHLAPSRGADAKGAPGSSAMAGSKLARSLVRLRMRDGSRIGCRIVDAGGVLSVHVDRDYDIPGIAWPDARTIVDIGANVGAFTIWAARRSPNAQILAVEPNPDTFDLLCRNIVLNGLGTRVLPINAAVGPAAGFATLDLVEQSLGTRISPTGTGKVHVAVQTLPGLVAQVGMVGKLDIVKIDCEGMEYDVFGGLDPAFLAKIATLMCEYHPEDGHEVTTLDRILRSAGFVVRRPDTDVGVIWATR